MKNLIIISVILLSLTSCNKQETWGANDSGMEKQEINNSEIEYPSLEDEIFNYTYLLDLNNDGLLNKVRFEFDATGNHRIKIYTLIHDPFLNFLEVKDSVSHKQKHNLKTSCDSTMEKFNKVIATYENKKIK